MAGLSDVIYVTNEGEVGQSRTLGLLSFHNLVYQKVCGVKTLTGGFPGPFQCRLGVLLYHYPFVKHTGEAVLCLSVAILGRYPVPAQSFIPVLLHP
jgi:hypothetical protein